jgi:hypothetical protein
MIYLLIAIGFSPGGSSTVHIYTQTIHRTTQNKQYIEQHNNLGECGPCPVLASYTLASALQLRRKHGKISVRVAASSQSSRVQSKLRINDATVTRADKGNPTVILLTQRYNSKLQEFIPANDFNTTNTDPSKTFNLKPGKQ